MRKLCALAVLVHLACLAWLGAEERGGPAHLDFIVPGGIPATLYLPGPAPETGFRFPDPPAGGNGPPAVLLVHGYTADRAGMSVLARRLARSGYGVLTIDVRGHGANPARFAQDPEGANLFQDLAAAADWLRASTWVDGTRFAVVGHSMGAGAALRFAERDVAVDAAVMISGGWNLLGPLRPPNALFLYAEADPAGIRDASERLAAALSGDAGEAGSFAGRDAVRALEMPGNDHTTILWSKAAAREIVLWLDASLDTTREGEPDLSEPRGLPVFVAAALLPFSFVGVGLAIGALAPAWPRRERRSWAALGGIAGALLLSLPLVSAARLGRFVGLDVVDGVSGLLCAAGLLLCAAAALGGDGLLPRATDRSQGAVPGSLLSGLVGFFAVYALLAPFGVLAHDLTPIASRASAGLALTVLFVPFFLGFEHCVRRGSPLGSFAVGLVGRALVLAVILLGAVLGIVPFVVTLLIGPLALVLLLGELVSAALYAASGNRLASATLQAALLAWMMASTMPLVG